MKYKFIDDYMMKNDYNTNYFCNLIPDNGKLTLNEVETLLHLPNLKLDDYVPEHSRHKTDFFGEAVYVTDIDKIAIEDMFRTFKDINDNNITHTIDTQLSLVMLTLILDTDNYGSDWIDMYEEKNYAYILDMLSCWVDSFEYEYFATDEDDNMLSGYDHVLFIRTIIYMLHQYMLFASNLIHNKSKIINKIIVLGHKIMGE